MMNNGDIIRLMSNEELSSFMFKLVESIEFDEFGNNNYTDNWLDWLNEVYKHEI